MELYATDIEKIRKDYINFLNNVVSFADESGSTFNAMKRQDEDLRLLLDECVDHKDNVRMQRPCNGHFTCTLIGASSAGKTTFLRELFPDLNDRGWLETDNNDTTSQGMVIEYSPEVKDVEIESYTYEDLKHFFDINKKLAEEGHVYYTYDDNRQTIHVNAEDIIDTLAVTPEKKNEFQDIKSNFKFERVFDLKPFKNFSRDGNEAKGVKSLTTMELSTAINEETGNNPLQMRALIKEIHLSSNFDHVVELLDSDEDKEIARCLEFIDTPGQGTAGVMKRDESLYYSLYPKSRNIVEQLCRDDELDFLVYLIRVGYQSNFKEVLWDKIRNSIPKEIFAELEQRLILLLNQTTAFTTNSDMKRRIESPTPGDEDHIAMYIKRNILDQFLGANTLPSAICFIDTLASAAADYKNTPEGRERAAETCHEMLLNMKEMMKKWTSKDNYAYNSMKDLKLIHENDNSGMPFMENVEHLCKKDDRGQGFFLKTLVDMIKNRGPEMLFKKHLVRTSLENDMSKLENYLDSKYNRNDGSLKSAELQRAFDNFVKKYKFREETGIEDFAQEHFDQTIDSEVEKRISESHDDAKFMLNLFSWLCDTLKDKIKEISSENVQAEDFIMKEIDVNAPLLEERFGYRNTYYSPDSDNIVLFKYFVKIHIREFLELLFYKPKSFTDKSAVQTKEDQEKVVNLFKQLDNINGQMKRLKRIISIS